MPKIYGWSQRFQDRWAKVKDDPAQAIHWKALPEECKHQITGKNFDFKNLVKSFTGRKYKTFTSKNGIITVPKSTLPGENILLDRYIKSGQAVRTNLSALVYYIKTVDKFTFKGKDEGGVKENVNDSKADFVALGVNKDWVVEIPNGRYAGTVLKVLDVISKNEIKTSGYQHSNSEYILHAPIKITLAEKFTHEGELIIFPADEVLYNPEKSIVPDNNTHRSQYTDTVRKYSMYYASMTPDQRKIAKSVLDQFTDLILYQRSTSLSDSDEVLSVYFGAYAHALVDPSRTAEILNHPLMKTWRDRIDLMISLTSLPDDDFAMWFEGTYYSPNTLKMLLQNAQYIEWYTGKDEFPELKARLRPFAEGLIQEFVPGFNTMFQWSDTQWEYDVVSFRRMDLLATLADMLDINNQQPPLSEILSFLTTKIAPPIGSHAIDSGYSAYSAFWNPYAEEMNKNRDIFGSKFSNNSKLGFTFGHSGMDAEKDSAVFNSTYSGTPFDHNPNSDNICLYRKGEWGLDWMRGYSSTDWETHYNCAVPLGEQTAFDNRGQTKFEKGNNWFIHSGTRSGRFVKEQTRTTYYYHSLDGIDMIFVHDVIDVPALPTEAQLLEYRHEEKAQMKASDFKHQINWFIPEGFRFDKPDYLVYWYGNDNGKNSKTYKQGKEMFYLECLSDDVEIVRFKNQTCAGKQATKYWYDLGSNKIENVRGYTQRVYLNQNIGRVECSHVLFGVSENDKLPNYFIKDGLFIAEFIGERVTIDPKLMKLTTTNSTPVPQPKPEPKPEPIKTTMTIDIPKGIKTITLNIKD